MGSYGHFVDPRSVVDMNEGEGIIGVICVVAKGGERQRVYLEIRGSLTIKPIKEEQDLGLEGVAITSLDQVIVTFEDSQSTSWILNDGVVLASQPLTLKNGRPAFDH